MVFLFHCSLFGSSWLIPNVSFYLFHLLSTMGSLSKMCLQTLSLLIGLGLNIFCKWNFHHRLLAYNCSKEFWDLFLRFFWLFYDGLWCWIWRKTPDWEKDLVFLIFPTESLEFFIAMIHFILNNKDLNHLAYNKGIC